MDDLFRTGLCNAAAAVILAIIAFAVGRIARRPALAHVLWLLVLVKLITPPIRCIEIEWPIGPPAEALVKSDVPAATPAPIGVSEENREEVAAPEIAIMDVLPAEPAASKAELAGPAASTAELPGSAPPPASIPWVAVAGTVWLTGSLLWFASAGLRIYHFRRLLCHARSAPPELRREVEHWAQELGIRRIPTTKLVPGRISPLLWWPAGRPQLFLPSRLWQKLDVEQRRALLVHELAHLRRGDHWVRLVEMVATGLYWWHPILWLARYELREAEEQCCDAWVVWALPGAGRTYALALVETLDFLSETRTSLPAAASGLGQVRNLRRRLSMIMRGTTPRRLSWAGLIAVFGAAALLLPFVPTLAQDSPRAAQEEEARARRRQAEAALQRAEAELQKARADVELARMQAENAERNAREMKRAGGGALNEQPQAYVVIIQDGQGREVRRIQARPGQTIRVPGGDGPQDQQPPANARFGRDPQPGARPGSAGGPPGGIGPGPGAGGPGGRGGPGAGPMMPGGPGGQPGMTMGGSMAGPDQERRLQNIERRLDEVMRVMERFMREQERRQPQPDRATPRRESRKIEEEEDIKVRPANRARTQSDDLPELPSDAVKPPAPSVPPANARPEKPGTPAGGSAPRRPAASDRVPDQPPAAPGAPGGTVRR